MFYRVYYEFWAKACQAAQRAEPYTNAAGSSVNKNRSTIGEYESENKEPDFDTLVLIADFFHVSTDYLLGRTEDRTSGHQPLVDTRLSKYQQELLEISRALNEHHQVALLERAKTLLDVQEENGLGPYKKSM